MGCGGKSKGGGGTAVVVAVLPGPPAATAADIALLSQRNIPPGACTTDLAAVAGEVGVNTPPDNTKFISSPEHWNTSM